MVATNLRVVLSELRESLAGVQSRPSSGNEVEILWDIKTALEAAIAGPGRAEADGYAPLDSGLLVPAQYLGSGTRDGTKFLRDDNTWQAPSSVTDHGALTGLADDDHTQYVKTDGWVAVAETVTFGAADAPSFTVTIPGDLTTRFQAGQRFKCTHGAAVKYFLITKVEHAAGTTTLTLYGGTDYTLSATAITLPFYSFAYAPFGFPMSPVKWTVEVSDTSLQSQSNPVQNTWYNLGSVAISGPIGAWNVHYEVALGRTDASAIGPVVYATLSTANNSESDADLTSVSYTANVLNQIIPIYRSKVLVLAAKTSYFLNSRTTDAGLDGLHNYNSLSKLLIRFVSAYL